MELADREFREAAEIFLSHGEPERAGAALAKAALAQRSDNPGTTLAQARRDRHIVGAPGERNRQFVCRK